MMMSCSGTIHIEKNLSYSNIGINQIQYCTIHRERIATANPCSSIFRFLSVDHGVEIQQQHYYNRLLLFLLLILSSQTYKEL